MKRWFSNLLLILFILIFLISGGLLAKYYGESQKQKNTFDHLADVMNQSASSFGETQVSPPLSANETSPLSETEPVGPLLIEVTDPETQKIVKVLPEFAELYTMNNHIVGWISIEGTNINYPVMQTPDNPDYYLKHSFEREYSKHGCIYVREVCDVFRPSDNLVIYGHRMGDGTLFNDLHRYLEADFLPDHSIITFNTLTEYRTYQIMYIFRISVTSEQSFPYHLFVDADDEAHFNEFLQNCQSRSEYDTGITASYGDKLITLSTCEYSQADGRLVVVAKQIT